MREIMKKLPILVAVITGLSAAAGSASAATSHSASGKISQMNAKNHHLTVSNHVYSYNPKRLAKGIQVGSLVKFNWRASNGHRIAYRIAPLQT